MSRPNPLQPVIVNVKTLGVNVPENYTRVFGIVSLGDTNLEAGILKTISKSETADLGLKEGSYTESFLNSFFTNNAMGKINVLETKTVPNIKEYSAGDYYVSENTAYKCLQSDTALSEEEQKEIHDKIDKIYNSDLSKACIFPELTTAIQKQYGFTDKKISLKENIIIKNKNSHKEITEELAKDILSNSLYKPEYVLKANPDKQNYHNFITRIGKDKNTIVLLDIDETKDYYEIVNYHIIDNKARNRKENINKKS